MYPNVAYRIKQKFVNLHSLLTDINITYMIQTLHQVLHQSNFLPLPPMLQ